MEAWDAHECIKFQWLVLQPSNHYLSFKIDLLKEEVCCSEIRGKFFGSDKNLTFSVYFKSFFSDMGIFPKNIWNEGYESK